MSNRKSEKVDDLKVIDPAVPAGRYRHPPTARLPIDLLSLQKEPRRSCDAGDLTWPGVCPIGTCHSDRWATITQDESEEGEMRGEVSETSKESHAIAGATTVTFRKHAMQPPLLVTGNR